MFWNYFVFDQLRTAIPIETCLVVEEHQTQLLVDRSLENILQGCIYLRPCWEANSAYFALPPVSTCSSLLHEEPHIFERIIKSNCFRQGWFISWDIWRGGGNEARLDTTQVAGSGRLDMLGEANLEMFQDLGDPWGPVDIESSWIPRWTSNARQPVDEVVELEVEDEADPVHGLPRGLRPV